MASITDIKRRILELSPAPFQEFCDTIISKHGYGVVHGLGMQAGTGNTTIGNPDTYFRKKNGKYVFIAYTIQKTNIYSKLREDIEKCLDVDKTGLDLEYIDEIICCHTSSNLSAGDDKKLHDLCESKGIELTIWGIDELANQVHNLYRSMVKNFLGLNIDTNQIFSIDDFIKQYDENRMTAPLSTIFKYREKESLEIKKYLESNSVVVVTGKAGVGKTKLVLESIRGIALTDEVKLLCVKNNNLGLYEDLVAATEQPGKYLFFIDDANELAELNQILAYIEKENVGYIVKVIVTVRDYAKEKVIATIKEHVIPQIVEVSSFSDDEIKGFLEDNLGIRNMEYINQIIRISEGNPRMAYMAGKLAVEKQNLSVIRNVSQLYDAYYKKYVDSALGSDIKLCVAAGILSVVKAVMLNNIAVLDELLGDCGITCDEFQEKILQLANIEVVEIQLDQVAAISDQCLANYMLYYVFFERKIIPFSKVVENAYKNFRNAINRTINTLLNIFESDELRKYCEQEILKVWNDFKKSNSLYFEEFAKDFRVFKSEEAFLIAQQKIEEIEEEPYDVKTVDFTKNVFCREVQVLEFLDGYRCSEFIGYVMELLLDYCSKADKMLVSGYSWLEQHYGIDIYDYKYGYYTQKEISDYILKMVLRGHNVAKALGYRWAKYSLGFIFHPTEIGRGNLVLFYNMEIEQSAGILEYRKTCWKILLELAKDIEWENQLVLFLDSYANALRQNSDYEIVSCETSYVEELLSKLTCRKIGFLKVIQKLLFNSEKIKLKYNEKWKQLLTGDEWNLYHLLERDPALSGTNWREYENKRKMLISEYGKNILALDIPKLVQTANRVLFDIEEERIRYSVNQGLGLLVQEFDEEQLEVFMNAYFKYGSSISIHPWTVLTSLNKSMDSMRLLLSIKEANFSQKNEWLFTFFDTLPESRADLEMMNELFDFLKNDSDKSIRQMSCRELRFLDKFRKVEPDIYPIACSIIYEKRKYSTFVVGMYFSLLFSNDCYSPRELLDLFQSNLSLLQDIYFLVLRKGEQYDLNGTFLTAFLSIGEDWLRKYSEFFWENRNGSTENNLYRNSALWKSENYKKYLDYIFYHFPEGKECRWRIAYMFKDALGNVENEDVIREHQQEWLNHVIIDNISTDKIITIFEFICELNDDLRRTAIKTFLDNNQELDSFREISILPRHWSGMGSFVPAYQRQIDFLESLYPMVSGVKYLGHKAYIKSRVDELREMITREEVEVICRNLYM